MNIDDRRPTTNDRDLTFWKTSNGHNSAMRHPIHFVFGSRVEFSGRADLTMLFLVGGHFENFQWPYLSNASSDSDRTLPTETIMTAEC